MLALSSVGLDQTDLETDQNG